MRIAVAKTRISSSSLVSVDMFERQTSEKRNDSVTVNPHEYSNGHNNWNKPPTVVSSDQTEIRPITRRNTSEGAKSSRVRRVLQHDDSYWLECGVGGSFSSQGPECSFVCKIMPTANQVSDEHALSNIEQCCWRITEDLNSHRSESDHHFCRCDFEHIRTYTQGKPGTCHTGSRYFSKLVWKGMQQHDQLCQCGCFDYESSMQPRVIPNWKYHPGYGCKSYWARRIKHPRGFYWLQYGVSSGPNTDGPDCSFICKLIPRAEETHTNLASIQACCERVVEELKVHRADERYSSRWQSPSCTCDFEFIRNNSRGQAGVCCSEWCKRASAEVVWLAMNRHDRLCSCGCFNFPTRQPSSADMPSYSGWKRHRKSKPYWSREVNFDDGRLWMQYGVNSNSDPSAEPDCITTCKQTFTTDGGRRQARKHCKNAAASLASHLKFARSCACDFESLILGQECSSKHTLWWKGRATKNVRAAMKKHNKCCACDCFEFL